MIDSLGSHATVVLIGWRGKFPHLSLFNCFETTHLFDFVSAELSTSGYAETFTFGLVPVETSTSGEAETFNFIFISDVKGLLVSLGHFNPYCLTREMHFHYVASGHLPLIKMFAFVFAVSTNLHGCFYPCSCVGTETRKYFSDFHFELLKNCCGFAIGVNKKTLKRLVAFVAGGFTVAIGDYDCCIMAVPEGWFHFINFSTLFGTRFCVPRAPRDPRGTFGDHRNRIIPPGASQVSSWSLAAALLFCFDPGAPQVPFGPPLGLLLDYFYRMLVVYRGSLRGSQVSSGAPRGSSTFVFILRDPWEGLVERNEIVKLTGGWPAEAADGNQLTFAVLKFSDVLNLLVFVSDCLDGTCRFQHSNLERLNNFNNFSDSVNEPSDVCSVLMLSGGHLRILECGSRTLFFSDVVGCQSAAVCLLVDTTSSASLPFLFLSRSSVALLLPSHAWWEGFPGCLCGCYCFWYFDFRPCCACFCSACCFCLSISPDVSWSTVFQSACSSVSQCVNQSTCLSLCRHVCQPVSQSVCLFCRACFSISQSVDQSVCPSLSRCPCRDVCLSGGLHVCQCPCRDVSLFVCRSICQSICQSVCQSVPLSVSLFLCAVVGATPGGTSPESLSRVPNLSPNGECGAPGCCSGRRVRRPAGPVRRIAPLGPPPQETPRPVRLGRPQCLCCLQLVLMNHAVQVVPAEFETVEFKTISS